MNKQDAKDYGITQGLAAIRYCEVGDEDRREAGCECNPRKPLATESVRVSETVVCEDCLTQAAFESEQNARQFSPFEFFAHDVNETGDRAEGLWESYDEGVGIGIRKGLQKRLEQLAA